MEQPESHSKRVGSCRIAGTSAFAATFIERAVEILVSPWRDEGASKLDKVVAAIKARPADPVIDAANATALRTASDALEEYRGDTQRYAFAVSLALSVMVSIAGVRALGPFVDRAKLDAHRETRTCSPRMQRIWCRSRHNGADGSRATATLFLACRSKKFSDRTMGACGSGESGGFASLKDENIKHYPELGMRDELYL